MAGGLKRLGPQGFGRIIGRGDRRAERNAGALGAGHLQEGEGLSRDERGRLQVDLEGEENRIATIDQIQDLQEQIDELKAVIEAAGLNN